jgi:hypothetical protein
MCGASSRGSAEAGLSTCGAGALARCLLVFARLLCTRPIVVFSVCVRTRFRPTKWNGLAGNPAPEGRTSLAQRFSAGKSGKKDSSPGGTTEFSRTLFSAGFLQAAPAPHCSHLLRHGAGNRGEHVIRIPADHSDGSNDDHQNHRQHHRVLSDVLTLFTPPQFSCQIC